MRVAIVHYHLGAGGVSRVIRTTSAALAEEGLPHVILCGAAPGRSLELPDDLPVRVIPGLGYRENGGGLTPHSLLEEMKEAAISVLGGPPDVWHFHNHSLGKNPLVPGVVELLSAAGESLVLQIHDLAEDGRPSNCRMIAGMDKLYPFSGRIHYVFLNARDQAIFTGAGLPSSCSRVMGNPVAVETVTPVKQGVSPLLFAPVRGIRRKNPGEMVLLSSLCSAGCRIATSLSPENVEAVSIHENWKRFAKAHRLPIEFGVVGRIAPEQGAGTDFHTWLSRSTHILSTSVAEGFGLPFLEAKGWRRPVIGRRIPYLEDLHSGCENSYDAILVPLDWVEEKVLRAQLELAARRNFRLLKRQLPHGWVEAAFRSLVRNGQVDFGNLPESLQQEVIERMGNPADRMIPLVMSGGAAKPLVEWLADALKSISKDIPALPEAFSPGAVALQLKELYHEAFSQPATDVAHVVPSRVMDACVSPASFHFLLSAPPQLVAKPRFRAVILDIYGTLLSAAPGGVKVDPQADPVIRSVIAHYGYVAPESPSAELHAAVVSHHGKSGETFPEVDLRVLWREILDLPEGTDLSAMVTAIEEAWHPAKAMPGAFEMVARLSRQGVSLGLLSNAQCNTLHSLGELEALFAPELRILSYQHGIAKPDMRLFHMMADRLEGRGISPAETLYIGDHLEHDIVPATAAGFATALLARSLPADSGCTPDHLMRDWDDLQRVMWGGG